MLATLKDKAGVKKMSKSNSKALNKMKFLFKKHESLKAQEAARMSYRENPDAPELEKSESEDDSTDQSTDEDEGSSGDESSSQEDQSTDGDDESSDSGDDEPDWDALSSSSSDDSDDDERDQLSGRARWVKKKMSPKEIAKEKEKQERKEKEKAEKEAASIQKKRDALAAKEAALGAKEVEKEEVKMTPLMLKRRLKEVVAMRGKKNTNPYEQIKTLSYLSKKANKFGARKLIPVLMHLIAAHYDTCRMIDQFLSDVQWKDVHRALVRIVQALSKEPLIQLEALESEELVAMRTVTEKSDAKSEDAEGENIEVVGEPTNDDPNVLRVVGNLGSFTETLFNMYMKHIRSFEFNITEEYVNRLRDEAKVLSVAKQVQDYYQGCGAWAVRKTSLDTSVASRIALLRCELLYYKHDNVANHLQLASAQEARFGYREFYHPACLSSQAHCVETVETIHPAALLGTPVEAVKTSGLNLPDSALLLEQLHSFIYNHGDSRSRCRADLCLVFHHALHDRFFKARDMLLVSKMQQLIASADVPTQVLYNRMKAQLGLCAFRLGRFKDARDCLDSVFYGRDATWEKKKEMPPHPSTPKQLLAQGVVYRDRKNRERSPAEIMAQKRRQTPFHMHINIFDLLDCCRSISNMIIAIPEDAQGKYSQNSRKRRSEIGKARANRNRKQFVGPPETNKDFILDASDMMCDGDWKGCCDLIFTLPMWSLMQNPKSVKDVVRQAIKEETLRAYLWTFSSYYESMSQEYLQEMFEISSKKVHAIVSKMLLYDELFASWDQPTQTLVLHKVEPSVAQDLALRLAEKAGLLVEKNEDLMGSMNGLYNYTPEKEERWSRGRGKGRNKPNYKGSDKRTGNEKFRNQRSKARAGFRGRGRDGRGRGRNARRGRGNVWGQSQKPKQSPW
jgi:translation initiation factor 3 subunit C